MSKTGQADALQVLSVILHYFYSRLKLKLNTKTECDAICKFSLAFMSQQIDPSSGRGFVCRNAKSKDSC